MLAIQSHWGLQQLPFAESDANAAYFPSETHEEALARLQYIVDQTRPAAIVQGDAGSGKTYLSRYHSLLTRERGFAAAWLNARNATESQLLETLADVLAIPLDATLSWSALERRLMERVTDRQHLLLTFDDADLATPDALEQLRGVLDRISGRMTMVLTSRAASVGRLHHRFGGISELRVVLEPWTLDDTVSYVARALAAVGGGLGLFDAEALERLHDRSLGRPRDIGRLARLALLAGAGCGLDVVDAETINGVADDLTGGA